MITRCWLRIGIFLHGYLSLASGSVLFFCFILMHLIKVCTCHWLVGDLCGSSWMCTRSCHTLLIGGQVKKVWLGAKLCRLWANSKCRKIYYFESQICLQCSDMFIILLLIYHHFRKFLNGHYGNLSVLFLTCLLVLCKLYFDVISLCQMVETCIELFRAIYIFFSQMF